MRCVATSCLVVACVAAPAAAAMPRITFELVTRPGISATAPQQWHEALTKLGISGLRIRSGTSADEMGIRNESTSAAPAYKVIGILSSDNMLYLPGGKFAIGDTARLREWLDHLGDMGIEGVTEPQAAFGLTPSQLQQVNDDLKRPVNFSTAGVPARDVVARLARGLRIALASDVGVGDALANVTVENELENVSSGTALAAVLRPAGLVLQPRHRRGGALEYHIGKPYNGQSAWPVGWPPQKRAPETLPLLFEHLNVEIKDIPVSEAVAAIAERLEVPFLYDQNALAMHGVDPGAGVADVPGRRMTYSQVLNRVLSQAHLRYDLLVDENEKPLVWITTVKPAP